MILNLKYHIISHIAENDNLNKQITSATACFRKNNKGKQAVWDIILSGTFFLWRLIKVIHCFLVLTTLCLKSYFEMKINNKNSSYLKLFFINLDNHRKILRIIINKFEVTSIKQLFTSRLFKVDIFFQAAYTIFWKLKRFVWNWRDSPGNNDFIWFSFGLRFN